MARAKNEPGPFVGWVRKHSPTREELAKNRFIKPFAGRVMRRELWRFTRRSVPRGAALGMIVGIFVMIPGLQMICSALIALPFRANIPVAAATTFTSNPISTPFILWGAIVVGNNVFQLDANTTRIYELYNEGAGVSEWLAWLASDAAPAMLGGLLIIAIVSGIVAYFLAKWFWRYRTVRKWRKRTKLRETDVAA